MSYEPTVWKTGDVVTSTKLNKLENDVAGAGGGGALVVNADSNGVLDKTAGEIMTAFTTGSVRIKTAGGAGDYTLYSLFMADYAYNDGFTFAGNDGDTTRIFVADTEADYPVIATD